MAATMREIGMAGMVMGVTVIGPNAAPEAHGIAMSPRRLTLTMLAEPSVLAANQPMGLR